MFSSRNGLMVAVHEIPFSNLAMVSVCVCHQNHCDVQPCTVLVIAHHNYLLTCTLDIVLHMSYIHLLFVQAMITPDGTAHNQVSQPLT